MRTKRYLTVELLEQREVFSANGLAECATFQPNPSPQADAIFADGFESGDWFDGSDLGLGGLQATDVAVIEFQDGDDLFVFRVEDRSGATQHVGVVFDCATGLNRDQFQGDSVDGGALANDPLVFDDTNGAGKVQFQSCGAGQDLRDHVMALVASGEVNWIG